MQSIRINSMLSTNANENNPTELIRMDIFQTNTYKTDLDWAQSDDKQGFKEKQQV